MACASTDFWTQSITDVCQGNAEGNSLVDATRSHSSWMHPKSLECLTSTSPLVVQLTKSCTAIVNHLQDTTASIYKMVALMATNEWLNNALFFYTAVRAEMVKSHHADALATDLVSQHWVLPCKERYQKPSKEEEMYP
jgi:hypothetical protein